MLKSHLCCITAACVCVYLASLLPAAGGWDGWTSRVPVCSCLPIQLAFTLCGNGADYDGNGPLSTDLQ